MTAEHTAPSPAPAPAELSPFHLPPDSGRQDAGLEAEFRVWQQERQHAIAAAAGLPAPPAGAAGTAPATGGTITKRVTLPSGGWAELKDPRSVRAKHRRAALDSMNMERLQNPTPGISLDMLDGLMLMIIERWHLPYRSDSVSPSTDPEALGELELPDYDTLSEHMEPARKLLFPQPASVDDVRPGSPTPPGGA
jgi:hypothetical protein